MQRRIPCWSLALAAAAALGPRAAAARPLQQEQGTPPAAVAPALAETPANAAAVRPPAANPADVASVDAIVAALYEVISGPAGVRDWDRFRSLFAPGARLIAAVPDPAGGARAHVMAPDDYVRTSGAYFLENGFFEREIARRTDAFGNIADLFSVYESRHSAGDAEPFQRGINSIQLLRDGDRWWVVTVFWDSERPDNPLPEKYLPGAAPPG